MTRAYTPVDAQTGVPGNDTLDASSEASSSPSGPLGSQRIADRYEVLALCGTGGMGTVYKVRDTRLDEMVALKVLRDRGHESPAVQTSDHIGRLFARARLDVWRPHPHWYDDERVGPDGPPHHDEVIAILRASATGAPATPSATRSGWAWASAAARLPTTRCGRC
jgi:hypothetical protein